MSEPDEDVRGTALGIVVEHYESPRFRTLTDATARLRELCALLEGHGYRPTVVEDPGRDALRASVTAWSDDWNATGGHGPAIVVWSGHAVLDDRALRLIVRDTRAERDADGAYSADRLASAALFSGADQILMLIDTCYAGAGVMESLREALGKLAKTSLPPGRTAWLGIVASCRPLEKAEAGGILVKTVTEVLRDGPRSAEYRHEWSRRNGRVTGSAVMRAVADQWPQEAGQRPVPATIGEDLPMFGNPRRRAAPEPELVEHLVRAARGADRVDEGWFFSGRRRVLGEIVEWLAARQPGLFLVTGSAGSGKSAVLGRISTLSDRKHRADILEHDALGPDDPDPGPDAVDASLHLRGFTVQQLAEAVARELRLPPPATPAALIAEVELQGPDSRRGLVLVLDGLDEAAPDQAGPIVEQLLAPLSRLALILLGSRDRPFQPQAAPGEPLDRALGRLLDTRVRASDLDEEPDTRQDIEDYGHRRLKAGGLPPEDAGTAARLIAQRASTSHGGFLFARMATGSVIRQFAASGASEWEQSIPSSISAAFTEDLRDDPAAQDLLTALAWSAGNGMPARGVWEAAASALSAEGTEYGPADVDRLLNTYGRYVVEDTDGTQAVYRLYHREFVAHLQRRPVPDPAHRVARAMVGLLRSQSEEGAAIEKANPYLRRSLAKHASAAGDGGLALVRELAEVREEVFRPHLAQTLMDIAVARSRAGLREAVGPSQEAVDLFRTLAGDNPSAYLPELAMALNNMSVHQKDDGDRRGSLVSITEAVAIHRTLAESDPAAYLSGLAVSLNNLAMRQAKDGDLSAALATSTEAVDLYEDLARLSPAAYLPELAAALNNLAVHHAGTGDRKGSLRISIRATEIYLTLAKDNVAYTSEFGRSLNNLSMSHADNGNWQAALKTGSESVALHRVLAEESPAAQLPHLAAALNNLAGRQAVAGDVPGALATNTEAAGLYRALAEENPAVHLPDLATCLNNLASRQADSGDLHGALTTSTEATDLHRTLTQENPAGHGTHLAAALTNLAIHQAAARDLAGALATNTEAADLYRALSVDNPAGHLPNLATCLNNLASRQAASGDLYGALATSTEATDLHRALAEENRAYRVQLAAALGNLAIHQAEAGNVRAALRTSGEAADLQRALTEENGAHRAQLAAALHNLGIRQAASGDLTSALASSTEAAALYEALARENPDAHRAHRASALGSLAARQTETGDLHGAVTTSAASVALLRVLAEEDRAAHLPQLAATLSNLANRQEAVGDPRAALTSGTEAVGLFLALAVADPATYVLSLRAALGGLARLAPADQALAAFTEAENALAAHPRAARLLAVERAELQLRRVDADAGVRALIALAPSVPPAGTPDPEAFRARQLLRAHSRAGTARADRVTALWRETTGTGPPGWLHLPAAALDLAHSWLDCPDWATARAFWDEHDASLRSPEVASALEELALAFPAASTFLWIVRTAAATDADSAFRPFVTGELLMVWSGLPSWEESRAFLSEHAPVLLHDLALELLDSATETPEACVHLALLDFARADGIPSSYAYLESLDVLRDRIRQLLAASEARPGLLRAAGLLEFYVHGEKFTGVAHLHVASVLGGGPQDPASWPAAEPAARDRVLGEIAALIRRHPAHAPALGALIESLL
ncbi:tetratricopeptide repeat protein [Streptomyces sp. NPDC048258]|uniref:tetratricopeptide repeat protein n=1 Tax=Streptomyces sp. NPDC048258 TaxID=3365527 RepID=UPI0037218758